MKTNKVFKWLYGVFMFLPMLAIGVTCAYVTFNKNAKDSFGNNHVTEIVQLTPDTNYRFVFDINNNGNYDYSFYVNSTTLDDILNTNSPINRIRIRKYNNNPYINYYMVDNTSNAINVWQNIFTTFDINLNYTDAQNLNGGYIQIYNLDKSETKLDNAFYYAVDQFNESGFNKVDFVSFFDMFYNNTSIWTTFANTYFNYMLFVSLAFFIPRVLLWFINLAFAYSDGFERKSQRW